MKLSYLLLLFFLVCSVPLIEAEEKVFKFDDPQALIFESDGYTGGVFPGEVKIIEVSRRGKVLGLHFSLSPVYFPGYFLLMLKEPLVLPDHWVLRNISLSLRGLNWNIDPALLAEDSLGSPYEFPLGKADRDGWVTLVYRNHKKVDGLAIKGFVFYMGLEDWDSGKDRIIYLEKLTLSGYGE